MSFLRNTWMLVAGIIVGCSSQAFAAGPPQGWFLAGNRPADYTSGTDAQVVYAGQPSAYLKSIKPEINGFGTLMQEFKADDYLGKRVRFSAFVRTEAVQDWAGLWMRVDKGREAVSFDNMQDRPIKGTTAWQSYAVVLDVPSDATGLAFGILVHGVGSAWINGVVFEVVTAGAPVTGNLLVAPNGPQNLPLAGSSTGAPSGWMLAGSKPASYAVGTESAGGAYLKSTQSPIDGFGTLMQMFKANDYLGKRVQFTGSVKAEAVALMAGLWMRVDKGTASVAFDNMQDRPIKGSTAWQTYSVVLDVPQDATGIAFGISLASTGEVWLKDVTFAVVGPGVPTTGKSLPAKPVNLGFEK
jgi:hypothetical protein